MLKKHLKMDYGSQTWYISGFYLLAFAAFILVNLGVVSYMWGEGDREAVYSPDYSEKAPIEKKQGAKKHPEKKGDVCIGRERSVRDTVDLLPYFYPYITQKFDTCLLIVPVVNKMNKEFYVFRTDSGEKLIAKDNTKIIVNTKLPGSIFITERILADSDTWYGTECTRVVSEVCFIESNKRIELLY